MGRIKGFEVSEETRKKIGNANKGKKQSEEVKRIISMKNKGNRHTDETKEKISKANKGRIVSDETKEKLSKSNKGKIRTPDFHEIINKKGYILIRINGKNVLKHRYIWEKYNGKIQEGMIIHHIDEDKTNNNIENLQIMTIGEHNSLHEKGKNKSDNRTRKICQFDKKSLVLIKTYDRLSDITGFSLGCISNCCNLKRNSHKGFLWYFLDECILK